jgi:anti-anti-sigma factor
MNTESQSSTGWPSQCPLCGEELAIGPLQLPGEAACAHCGHVLWFSKREIDDVIILDVISGKVAINQEIGKVCEALILHEKTPKIILNLSHVQFVSSSFIAGLIALHKRFRAAGGQLVMYGMSPVVWETLQGAKLDKLLNITATESEALSSF